MRSSVTYTLAANVENLVLTGAAAINGTGNALDNMLTGNAGNNTLDGGLGADTMAGGLGNDIYVVDNAGDVVSEAPATAPTPVQSSVTYTLGGQRREPDADRGGGDQRHRQRAGQHPHRQRRQQHAGRRAGADTHGGRRSATTSTSSTTPATW